jgi:hypothetical protein
MNGAKYRVAGILGKLLKEGKGGSRMNTPEISEPPSPATARHAEREISWKFKWWRFRVGPR